MKNRIILLVLVSLFGAIGIFAQDVDPVGTPVTVEYKYWIPSNKSRQQARKVLLKKARKKAVEKVLGVNVQVTSVMLKGEDENAYFESYKQLARNVVNGRIVEEQKPNYFIRGRDTMYIRYSCKVAKVSGRADPDFQIDIASNKSVFNTGEELILEVTPTKDAYITIFSITEDNKVSVLFPNKYMSNNKVEKHTTRIIPNLKERNILSFIMQPHHEKPQSTYSELLFVVATKRDISYNKLSGQLNYDSNWIELNRWLLDIPRNEWVEAFFQYQVFPQ